jgi:hypothetical protein
MEPDFRDFLANGDDSVPSVDPGDLRTIWRLSQDMNRRHPDKNSAIGMDLVKQVCSPTADCNAVSYRFMMLGMLETMCALLKQHADAIRQAHSEDRFEQLTNKWLSFHRENGDLDEAVFKVAARFPVKKIQAGVVSNELPFDATEFLNQIEFEAAR